MFAPDFLPHVERSGKLLRRKLEDLAARFPHVLAEVRGTGLMLGLKCVVTNTDLVARLREEGLLTVGAAENVVRLLPPLIIEDRQVEEAVQAIERACSAIAQAARDDDAATGTAAALPRPRGFRQRRAARHRPDERSGGKEWGSTSR